MARLTQDRGLRVLPVLLIIATAFLSSPTFGAGAGAAEEPGVGHTESAGM